MSSKLFQTKSDAFFLVIKVEDNHIEFLIERNHFFGMAHASP